MTMKQLEVTIMGQSYMLACPAGREATLLEAVATVDREMCEIRDAGKVKARERIAVLAALNLAYALSEQQQQHTAALATVRAQSKMPPAPAPVETGLTRLPPEYDALLRRIDRTLGHDGQLL